MLVAGVVWALAACAPVGPPQIGPAQPAGPTLAFVVVSRADETHVVGYEFDADTMSGAGEGEVECGSALMHFGEILGEYTVLVDGEEAASGRVPNGVAPGSFLVFRVDIDADGSATVFGPNVARALPDEPPVPGPCS